VQIMGEVPRGSALRRDCARVGDDIWVSGTLGDAALALAAFKRRIHLKPAELERCAARLHRPQPRVALGLALRGVAHAAIDVSDGLVADLGHILEHSHVAAEIELAALPRSSVLRRYRDHAAGFVAPLAGGDDYELCFTATRRMRQRIARIGRSAGILVTRIGHVRAHSRGSPRLVVRTADGHALRTMPKGYDHFG